MLGGAGLGLQLAARLPRRAQLPAALVVIAALLPLWADLVVDIMWPD
jgi:hypothetical protein